MKIFFMAAVEMIKFSQPVVQTITAALFIFVAVELFEWRLASELTDKGYEEIEVIPHVTAE